MKVLVIEDEESLRRSIIEYFVHEDFVCDWADTYKTGVTRIEDFEYDCVILDINLPGGSGLDLLKYLRMNKKEDGVIIISARNSVDDRVAGLDLGADDYLTKPFHLSELNARVKALIRRKYSKGSPTLEMGDLTVEIASRTASFKGQALPLTKNEFDLLLFMAINKNRVLSKRAIGEHLFGEQADNLSSFDFVYSHVKNLKKKFKEKGAENLIQTVYGLGYKLAL